MFKLGKTRPLPGHINIGSISAKTTSSWRASTHHGVQQGRQLASQLTIVSTYPTAVSLRGHRREVPPAD
ncbi:hypothetical protein TNCV_72771 [Trichonephila clavipes]|uniref:Uncharacterized protein n=1 Tax=Trichonephila clavipes TaxID=2585209 RepID=A0A8X6RBI5_TRICX|nr:hypothetical protein TNCV_72771 [Trichonephila clavipes]